MNFERGITIILYATSSLLNINREDMQAMARLQKDKNGHPILWLLDFFVIIHCGLSMNCILMFKEENPGKFVS